MRESMQPNGNGKLHSVDEALDLLSHVVGEKGDEIRSLLARDYRNLKNILMDAESDVRTATQGIRDSAMSVVSAVKDKAVTTSKDIAKKVDDSAHEHTWKYIGFTALIASLFGFFFSRRNVK